jgi:hypothetical protein
MVKTTQGTIHGKVIELDEDLGIADGQQVEIHVKVVENGGKPAHTWGEGLRRCAGALASEWTEEDDRILDEIYQERKRDTRPEVLE